jgi:hypothetical protein
VARDLAQRRHGIRDGYALRQDRAERGEHYQRAFDVDRDIGTAAVRQRDKSVGVTVSVSVKAGLSSFGHVEDLDPGGDNCSGGQPEFPASRCPELGGAEAEADDRAAL